MIIDSLEKEMSFKIVYFGPALSGKTTTLESLLHHFGKKDLMLRIDNSVGRTLYFDYGTIQFQSNDWKVKIHAYATTGQDFYLITRPTTLRAADGLIFV